MLKGDEQIWHSGAIRMPNQPSPGKAQIGEVAPSSFVYRTRDCTHNLPTAAPPSSCGHFTGPSSVSVNDTPADKEDLAAVGVKSCVGANVA